jgi:hypothetical protein
MGVSGKNSRFSNKNLIYGSHNLTQSIPNFKAESESKKMFQSMNRQNSSNLLTAKQVMFKTSNKKSRNSSVPKSRVLRGSVTNKRGQRGVAFCEPENPDFEEKLVRFDEQSERREKILKFRAKRKSERKSRSPIKKRSKSTKKELNFETHMRNVKEFWGKSIKEIQDILMEKDKFEYKAGDVSFAIWKNSNLLLGRNEEYFGIKTGNTSNAKFCLATFKKTKDFEFLTSKYCNFLILSSIEMFDKGEKVFRN